jgi:hypothetical protein
MGETMDSDSAQYLLYGLLGVALMVWIISRQVGERTWSVRRLVMFPLIFVVVAVINSHDLGKDLAGGLAVTLFVGGLVLAVVLGLCRAHTMGVRPGTGNTIVTTGNWRTITWWIVSIGVRVGLALMAGALGVHESTAEAMLFAAVTIGIQNVWLARRGGLLKVAPAA